MVNKKKASSKEKPGTEDKLIVLEESPGDLVHRIEMLEKRAGIKTSRRDH